MTPKRRLLTLIFACLVLKESTYHQSIVYYLFCFALQPFAAAYFFVFFTKTNERDFYKLDEGIELIDRRQKHILGFHPCDP